MIKEPTRRAGPRLQLKNIEYFERMSQETPCFIADVLWEDKHVAYVENRGTGGCCHYAPTDSVLYAKMWRTIEQTMHTWASQLPGAPEWEALDWKIYDLLDEHLLAPSS